MIPTYARVGAGGLRTKVKKRPDGSVITAIWSTVHCRYCGTMLDEAKMDSYNNAGNKASSRYKTVVL